MIRKNILMLLFLSFSLAAYSQMEIEEVSVTNLSEVNSAEDDFVAVPYGKGIMFNSIGQKNPCDTCGFLHSLRFADVKPNTEEMTTIASGDCSCASSVQVPITTMPKKSNFSTPSFCDNGKTMYMTQNFRKPGGGETNSRESKLKIVKAQLNDQNSWTNFTDVSFNMRDYETAHPTLSADCQTMYFASDRPGGVGGMDIWKVMKQGDGWGNPVNMGSTINSAGNEIFPNVNTDGVLHYSSNKPGGMGGLDVYKAAMDGGTWTSSNIGAPYNSRGDDLGYTESEDGESGYITSDRAGGKGKDDIYCWKVNKAPVKLAVEDAVTTDRLPGSKINIVGPKIALDYVADGNGGAEPDITYRRDYTINVTKEGYIPWSKTVTAKELAAVDTYIVPLEKRKDYSIVGDVKVLGTDVAIPGAKIVLHNITTGEKREVIADENGLFRFDNITCVDDYELIAYKDDRESAKYPLPASMIDCASDDPTEVPLRIPAPPEPPVVECDYLNKGKFSIPVGETPKMISALGSRPEFGNVHGMDAAGFYNKLKRQYDRSARDKAFLDELFTAFGYSNGFADVSEYSFTDAVIPNGSIGNMGYTKRHRMKYVQLNARFDRDLQAFRVSTPGNCDIYFMKTCGNFFILR